MTGNIVPPPISSRLKDPSLDPFLVLDEWEEEQTASIPLSEDPAAILEAREEAASRRAAIAAFLVIDNVTGQKYGKGIRYLFAVLVQGQDPADIAQREKITPEQLQKDMDDACLALRQKMAPQPQP